jgi:hypothetical protein
MLNIKTQKYKKMYVFSLSIKTQNDMSDIYVLKELYIYFETRRLLWIN